MARDAGFDVVQAPTTPDEIRPREIKNAAAAANIRIDSVMNTDSLEISAVVGRPQVVEKSLAGCGPPSTMPALGFGHGAARSSRGESAPRPTATLGRVLRTRSAS